MPSHLSIPVHSRWEVRRARAAPAPPLCPASFCAELCVEVKQQTPFANVFCMPSAPTSLAASAHALNTLCLFPMVVESEWTSKYVEQVFLMVLVTVILMSIYICIILTIFYN